MKKSINDIIEDYRDILERLPHLDNDDVISALIVAASNERAADRIATSIDSLELVVRTKKPEGL